MRFSGVHFLKIVVPLIGAGLMGTAIYASYNILTLKLPLSGALGLTSTMLPLFSVLGVQYLRTSFGTNKRGNRGGAPRLTEKMLIATFSLLILDAVVVSLASTSLGNPEKLTCPINTSWNHIYSTNQPGLKKIQDALDCCGLHSESDKFYPKPTGPPPGKGQHPTCLTTYPTREGRPCFSPWLAQTQTSSSILLGIALASAVLKITALLFVKFAANPVIQRFLFNPWFGKAEVQANTSASTTDQGRVSEIENGYSYDDDARVVGANNGYHVAGAGFGESDRLLENDGNRRQLGASNGRSFAESGFGALQPSALYAP